MIESIAPLVRSLRDSQKIIEDYVLSIPAETLAIKRKPGFWSIAEHVYHLAETQDMLFGRIRMFRTEARPKIMPYFPDANNTQKAEYESIRAALNAFETGRSAQCGEASLLLDADLAKQGEHPEYKQYNVYILLNHILFHDYWHMYRIEELWLTRDEYLSG
jgi:uncharacterized damage-inducible protein DinB